MVGFDSYRLLGRGFLEFIFLCTESLEGWKFSYLSLSVKDILNVVLSSEFVHREDSLLGVVSPEDVPLEDGESVGSGDVVGTPHDVEPVLTVVVHRLDVVQEDVGPVDPLCDEVEGDPAGLVECVCDESFHQGAVHVSPQDLVVVGDEHQAHLGVQGDVGGRREVAGHHDGVVVRPDTEDVDLLAERVHHVQVVGDPVHGHGHGRPGSGNTGNIKILRYNI